MGKKHRPAAVVPPSPIVTVEHDPSKWERLEQRGFPYVWALLLFCGMTIPSGGMALALTVLALASVFLPGSRARFRAHCGVPVLGLLAFALIVGFAAIASPFGDYAVVEFQKYLTAFALTTLLLTRGQKGQLRSLLWATLAVCSVIALLSIDNGGLGLLYDGFNAVSTRLGASWALQHGGVTGSRLNGIYNDSNVTANLFALGSLLAVHLLRTMDTTRKWVRPVAFALLGLNTLSFFLSLSRGAILSLAFALLVYWLAVGKGQRLSLFFLLLETALMTVVFSAVTMRFLGGTSALPTLLSLVCGLTIWPLDRFLGQPMTRFLAGHGKKILAACCALVLLCGVYAVAAWNLESAYTFSSNGSLFRSVKLAPGEYTLTVEADGPMDVTVLAYTPENVLMNTAGDEAPYSGSVKACTFTILEGTQSVGFSFRAEPGTILKTAALSDGTALHLGYPLIPEFVASRLQDSLLTSYSTVMRLQYLRDGWQIFTQSPLLGHGLASSQGLIFGVQPVYYESQFVHNHLLQLLDDTGVVGLACFLVFMAGAAWLLLRRLFRQREEQAAMLLACWVMMNFHGLMEITFSMWGYLCLAYGLTALVLIEYGAPLPEKWEKPAGVCVLAALWVWLAVYGGLFASHLAVQKQLKAGVPASNVTEVLELTQRYTRLDVFDHEQMQVTFVANATVLDSPQYAATLRKYVAALRESGTYYACSGLAQYYDLPRGDLAALFADSRAAIAQRPSGPDSWNLQIAFYRDTVLPALTAEQAADFLNGVSGIAAYLADYTVDRIQPVVLDEAAQGFLDAVAANRDLTGQAALDALAPLVQPTA